ncbi:hypothetical protein [Thalassospira sp.]|uniref:hypothetical protein n=1 Tax=Thalassospira sp. TaxID=1912094 RepID=UPI0032F050BB
MYSVVKATLDDQEPVISFLLQHLGGREDAYRRIFRFSSHFCIDESNCPPPGFCIKGDDGSIAGFIGFLASRPAWLADRWLVNMTSWAVSANARSLSLKLLLEATRQENWIITNYSATEAVQAILPRFQFHQIDNAEVSLSTVIPGIFGGGRALFVRLGQAAIDHINDVDENRVLQQHFDAGAVIMYVPGSGRSYVFFRKRWGRMHALQFMHASFGPSQILIKDWKALAAVAFIRFRAARVIMDERFLPIGVVPAERKPRAMFVKGLGEGDTVPDRAYSEPIQSLGVF